MEETITDNKMQEFCNTCLAYLETIRKERDKKFRRCIASCLIEIIFLGLGLIEFLKYVYEYLKCC